MENPRSGLLQGTLDLLVLHALRGGPRHGYGVMAWLHETSGGELAIEEGALYPALHRLEARALVEAEWAPSENNRRAKFYRLTTSGRAQLNKDRATWNRYVLLVQRVLESSR